MAEKPFQGIATFLKSPVCDESRKVGVVGIPFDGATSFRPGARFAPNAVRHASMMLTDGHHPIFETEAGLHVTDLGDIATSTSVDKALEDIEQYYATNSFIHASKPLMAIGGDHTVTLGILRGLRRARAALMRTEDMVVIHFDAHCDTWEDSFGEPIGHGTWVRNAVTEGLVKAENVLSIGLRSPADPVTRQWLMNEGGRTISSRGALATGAAQIAQNIAKTIRDRPWYLSFDIDALDPAYAPGTGTPEIAGLTPHFVLDVLETMNKCFQTKFLGMDVVEVNPSYDPTQVTSLCAATILWTVASVCAR